MSEYIVDDKWLREFENNLEQCIVGDRFEYDGHTNPTPPLRRIVRCRDCTHFITWANGYSFCSAFSIGATGDPFPGEPDGFCAWGARRDV